MGDGALNGHAFSPRAGWWRHQRSASSALSFRAVGASLGPGASFRRYEAFTFARALSAIPTYRALIDYRVASRLCR